MEIEIIYSDEDIVVLNKPAGVLVHKPITGIKNSKKSEETTIVDWVLKRFPEVKSVGDRPRGVLERPGVVHRLDRETSGVLIVARNQASFENLKKQFQNHEIKKTYLALVYGEIEKPGKIDKPIGLKPGTTKRSVTARNMKMIKDAVTRYIPKKHFVGATLLEVFPETGRTHQIRVHLASIGHPIVGDILYGGKKQIIEISRQFLHAESIAFMTVGGKSMKIEAELPSDLEKILTELPSIDTEAESR